ncbi:MAG: hypothetical protein JW959_10665 [Pirellulales bacterium]|nr:hypothetical protein [Pirellulales bacterium]
MTAPSRTAQFAKVYKVLKKSFKAAPSHAGRTVLEHLVFACCLEDARHDAAEEAFAALVHTFFDWNEVRVTSISELAEVMSSLPDPRAAANRVKRVLHAVFEATFNFDLEAYRKKNIGPTAAWLQKLDGTTGFTVAYVVQSALGGHNIPVDRGTLDALLVLDLISEKDAAAGNVPGLERAVAKSKGIEFASLLHELGAAYAANPYSKNVRDILLMINPDCGDRLPKRRVKRKTPEPPPRPEKKQDKSDKSKAKTPTKGDRTDDEGKKSAADKDSPSKEPKKMKTDQSADKPKSKARKKSAPRTALPGKQSSSRGLSKRKPR